MQTLSRPPPPVKYSTLSHSLSLSLSVSLGHRSKTTLFLVLRPTNAVAATSPKYIPTRRPSDSEDGRPTTDECSHQRTDPDEAARIVLCLSVLSSDSRPRARHPVNITGRRSHARSAASSDDRTAGPIGSGAFCVYQCKKMCTNESVAGEMVANRAQSKAIKWKPNNSNERPIRSSSSNGNGNGSIRKPGSRPVTVERCSGHGAYESGRRIWDLIRRAGDRTAGCIRCQRGPSGLTRLIGLRESESAGDWRRSSALVGRCIGRLVR